MIPLSCIFLPGLSTHQKVSNVSQESKSIAWIKYLPCPAMLDSLRFRNSSNSLNYTLDSQAKELTLVLLQWHNCTLQLCLYDSHLDKPQQCQHISHVTGKMNVQREQEILHELFDSVTPLMGDKAGTDRCSSRSHLAEEKLAWWEDREGNNIAALCSEEGRQAVLGSHHRG